VVCRHITDEVACQPRLGRTAPIEDWQELSSDVRDLVWTPLPCPEEEVDKASQQPRSYQPSDLETLHPKKKSALGLAGW
jgi:hypothetical protein